MRDLVNLFVHSLLSFTDLQDQKNRYELKKIIDKGNSSLANSKCLQFILRNGLIMHETKT